MKLEKGVQHFTTGVPSRGYSPIFDYHHPSRTLSRRQTYTSSESEHSVIAYLVLDKRNFISQIAIKNKDGSYRTRDNSHLTKDEIDAIHRDNSQMRSLVNLLKNSNMYYPKFLPFVTEKLGLDQDLVKADIGHLILEGVIGYNCIGELTAAKNNFTPEVFTTRLNPWRPKKSKEEHKAKTMPCSF
ncbi:MAG: hypothetical protein WCK29_04275 [archaeon]